MSDLLIQVPEAESTTDGHWTLAYRKPILFLIATLVAAGIYLAFAIPVSVFPNTDFPRIVIGADNGVFPIDQMLVTVTKPIEEAVNTVPGLDHLWSITSRGTAEIDLFFTWQVDMHRTLSLVNAALARVQPVLPTGAKLTANRLTFAAFPIMGYSLTSDTVSQSRLWELATYEIKPRLNRQAGISSVVVQGGQVPEFQVEPEPARLVKSGVTIPNILDAIGASNMIDSPGLIEMNHQLVLGLVSGQARTAAAIANIVVKPTLAGTPVHIGDVATVSPSVAPVFTVVRADRKPAVLVNMYRQPDGNTIAAANAVHAEIERMRKELPKDIHLRSFYDQSEIVQDSIRGVRNAILIGMVLASLIAGLFLWDWGASIVAGLVIPITIAVTLMALRLMHESINLMTMGGLAAAVGLVIQDAIVVVENIALHRDSGQTRGAAVRNAIREIRAPLMASAIAPIVVFLPLILLTGVTGVFFRALAVATGVGLATSLALAFTWTPALSHYLIRRKRGRRGVFADRRDTAMPRRLVEFYERTLLFTSRHPALLAVFAVLLAAGSYICYKHAGSDLLPEMDEGGFIVDYIMPAGSSLEETNRVVSHVEEILLATPEVDNITRRTGLQLGLAAVTEANTGDLTVKLKRGRRRATEAIIAGVRAKITKAEPVLDVGFPQLLQDMIGDLTSEPEPIVIKLFSQDPDLLRRWAPRVARAVKKIPGVVDVLDGIENTISGPAVLLTVDPSVVARAGFTAEELQTDTSAILQGTTAAAPVVVNDRSYPIRVRFPPATRTKPDAIPATVLLSGSGRTASMASLAKPIELPGQTQIRRENLQRDVQVTGRLEGLNLGAGMARVRSVVDKLGLPPGIRVQYGGRYQEQQKSFREMAIVLALAITLVIGVMVIEFGNFAAPAAVLASSLLSSCGVFVALLITRTTFNLSSFMGLVIVIGIVAKHGILLLDAEQKFRAEGMPAEQSMLRAGARRLRPTVMTALVTVACMLPLALSIGAGSLMLQPLAIAVIGGILTAMLLSLVVTPSVRYYLGGRA
jgi:multidrug efflux pump subunit AcrB